MKRWLTLYTRFDWGLLLAVLTLSAIGLLAIYGMNVSRGATDFFQLKKQVIAVLLGLAAVLLIPLLDYRHIRSFSLPLYLATAAVLFAVLVIGTTSRNAGRWFVVGSFSFQPVELAKLSLAVFLAGYLGRHAHKRLSWVALAGSGVATALYVGLVLLQPDFGSAMVLVVMWLAAILFCGLPRHAWWIMLVSLVAVSALVWTVGLRQYQKDRITSFLDPSVDPLGTSYNVTQARIAIGSGGFFGKGIGEGSQARLRFLPEASTDFMFAVLGEELGFTGIVFILGVFGYLLYQLLHIARQSDDAFAGLALVLIAAFILCHVIVNAGMNLGLLPVTGIPLPFLSAAASSVVIMYLTIGFAESIAVHGRRTY